jgi:hypothetical protein
VVIGRTDDLRSLDIAETGPEDLQVSVRLERNVTNLRPYVFAFAIAVGPNEKNRSMFRLSLNVACHDLLILHPISQPCRSDIQRHAHLCNGALNRGFEEIYWLARVPFSEPLMEVLSHNVASDAGKCHRAWTPLLKAIVKLVILDPLYTANTFLLAVSFHTRSHASQRYTQL